MALMAVLGAVPAWGASREAPRGRGGAVASGDATATAVGMEVMRGGGNAVDAAVATALALAVTFPEAGNLAGGGFAVVRMGEEVHALDFREVAPGGASRDMYLDKKGEPVAGASQVGPLASGVPGSPAGLYELHRRFGKLEWKQVVEPARRLAEEGWIADEHLRKELATTEKERRISRFPETARVWYPDGKPLAPGSRVRLPEMARTLAAYEEKGPEGLYAAAGSAVEAAVRRHGGRLTAADMAAYRPAWREPLRFEAYGWRFASMPLPSAGGAVMGQVLAVLERLGWERLPRFGAERAHLLAEALRRAYADRTLLGDPASARARTEDLLDPVWIARRAAEIDPRRATPSSAVFPWPGEGSEQGSGEPSETTHLSVVDGAGNLVALTTTINDLFGCGLFVPEVGFLNNEMDDFTSVPGKPNLFGLIQGEANSIAPGKRMLSSMAPTIAWRGAEAVALGGRGGSRIPTHMVQVLLNLLADGDPLQTALDRPRLHHQAFPDRIEVEADTLAPETKAELERRGHTVALSDKLARVVAVRRLPSGEVEAAVDPRGSGEAAVGAVPVAAAASH
jgi:gamma-glutamyltranspeptidase / glutathione hydrolase